MGGAGCCIQHPKVHLRLPLGQADARASSEQGAEADGSSALWTHTRLQWRVSLGYLARHAAASTSEALEQLAFHRQPGL